MLKTAIITEIHSEQDIVTARQKVKQLAKTLNFSAINQVRISTAVSELARNIYLYAGTGRLRFESVLHQDKAGIKLTATDQGPGIPSIRRVLEDGYSTSGGLGMGLPGVKRLMDEFLIDSCPGIGTTIIAVKWV
ncbi:serine/threonine-protein kinase RsbT [Fictibacillus solisalsi]|uniref:Serine/threonine-protein kinase RsbT n=1 Tax=Fictibacillus solisalsi TaxID=459525 RepID=A0A1G9YR74_9BACL|nr:anti-sigma regulatory factor [Fictibacillus solisalsi]SDN10983.1 serine/threonine-protein kinase RsbT [Fictibacillus solisalsi]